MDHRTQAILEDGARDLFSGAAIAVIEKGGGERWLCFGTHAPGDPLPITPGSLFDLASLTQPFAGAALLALCGRGAVSLEDRAGRWFGPGSQAKDRIQWSGLSVWWPFTYSSAPLYQYCSNYECLGYTAHQNLYHFSHTVLFTSDDIGWITDQWCS